MKKLILPLSLILFLLFSMTVFSDVAYVNKTEVTVNGGTSIAISPHTDTNVGDLLIVYIAKDDNVDIDETGAYADWTMLCNVIADSQTCLYVAWRIADSGDAGTPSTEYIWTSDSEDWVGEILTYSGNSATPIHASGSDYLDSSATPTAPSVAFTDLAAGSLVLQVFGCDFDDTPRTVPSQLTSRFNQHQANDIGGAGGDRECPADHWVSPSGFVDPDTVWDTEEKAYDENLGGTPALTSVSLNSWSSYIELSIDAISCSKVRTYAYYNAATINEISVDVYYSAGWHNIYEGVYENNVWKEHLIGSTQTVTAMRVKFYNDDGSDHNANFFEAGFWKIETTSGNTGTAVFGIPSSNEWTAATLVIEAAAAEEEEFFGTNF
jgi:hypothetical protein